MLSSYRRILSQPGTLLFSASGFVARLPISMVSLGIVLLVSAATGSYALAGSVSAAYMIANGGLAVVQGRLLDRLGQARVLIPVVAVFATSLTLLMWSVQADWPLLATYVSAAVAGGTLPAVGSCVRARWSHVLSSADQLQTAFALEAVWDETVFMLGPILVTVLATTWHPLAGLIAALVAAVVGTLAFAAQRSTEPPAHPRSTSTGPRPRMPWGTVVLLGLVCAALGALFGAAEVSTVAFAEEHGNRAYSGFLLALWAAGSLIAGVVDRCDPLAARPDRPGPLGRRRDDAGDAAAVLRRLRGADGGRAVRRRLRDRAHPDRDDVGDPGSGATCAAHRGDVDHPHRDRRRGRSRRHPGRLDHRQLRRLPGVPGRAGRRRGRRPDRADPAARRSVVEEAPCRSVVEEAR